MNMWIVNYILYHFFFNIFYFRKSSFNGSDSDIWDAFDSAVYL